MLDFETFIESLEHVPPEFERNFNLIKDLDSRSNDLIEMVNDLVRSYKEKRDVQERRNLKALIDVSMEKMSSYAHDKIELASQTYELIDKHIRTLICLSQAAGEDDDNAAQLRPGTAMPIDANEPIYCWCRSVSFGEMVACDNPECPIEWFHLPCVGLIRAPRAAQKWYCMKCEPLMKTRKRPPPKMPTRRTPKRSR